MKYIYIVFFLLFMTGLSFALGTTSGNGAGTSNSAPPFQMQTTTVANLPVCAAGTRGTMYVVTNSLLPAALAIVAAGGAVVVGVLCDGTNWIVL